MKIDAVYMDKPRHVGEAAVAAKAAGFQGFWVPETGHDPFLTLMQAQQSAPGLELGTAIAVAFARSPMTMAQTSYDLAEWTQGNFMLGLGSQVKAHITRRFSMPWHKPVEQMREFIQALRTIWKAFESGGKLDFNGEFYQLSLLTPFFSPHRHKFSPIPVGLAAVGPKMTALAGELADFVVLHGFTNLPYLREVTLPAVTEGLAKTNRRRSEISLVGSLFVITGDADARRRLEMKARQQIAFYGSTPAYAAVLESVGQGELASKLHAMSRRGEWEEMARSLPEDIVEHFCLRAEPGKLREAIEERYGGIYDRVMTNLDPGDLHWLGDS